MCGENRIAEMIIAGRMGSPPRVRGKRGLIAAAVGPTRITPACAGKTDGGTHHGRRCGDHPRVCGENSKYLVARIRAQGSPPRVRGKLLRLQHIRQRGGITPACAGKTGFLVVAAHGSKDHPRVCGENSDCPGCPPWCRGSPPRVRGKRQCRDAHPRRVGITPACAGKTPEGYIYFLITQDHPRVCGENYKEALFEAAREGSPPRVRGKLASTLSELTEQRITPACAGKTE